MLTRSKVGATLDQEIMRALEKLETLDPKSEEYGVVLDRTAALCKLKTERGLKPPSLDNVLVVSANLLGIVWITAVEREHVITTKAIGFILRAR